MGFEIDRRASQRTCVVHIDGDIDSATVPDLRNALNQVIETGCDNVVLDLEFVTYADSSVLGLLVWLDRKLQPRDGKAVLTGANSNVARVLELSGILTVMGRLETAEAAEKVVECFGRDGEQEKLEWTYSLEVSPDVGELASIREQVCEMLSPLGFSEFALFDIKVALGEALANAVRHGLPADGYGAIMLDVSCFTNRIVIEIADCGAGFDGEHVCSDDLYAVGGRGIMFMRALMDAVSFICSRDGGTRVILVKHRPMQPVE